MQQKVSWAMIVQSLDQPLATWLSKSSLKQINEFDSVLFLDKSNYFLLNNLQYLSKIYPAVKILAPSIRSLHMVHTPFLEYIKNNEIDLYSIEVL